MVQNAAARRRRGRPRHGQSRPLAFAETPCRTRGDALTLRQRLERTVTPPLYGTPAGAQEQQRLLQSARQDGTLGALAGQIEQGPVDAARADAQEAVQGPPAGRHL